MLPRDRLGPAEKSVPRVPRNLRSAQEPTPLASQEFWETAVVTGQFEQCRLLCERGLEKRGSDAVNSELAEWLAISQSELGFPIDMVRGSFDASIRFDLSNERAHRNFAAFEAATRPIRAGLYETRTRAAVRASGLSERRLKPAA